MELADYIVDIKNQIIEYKKLENLKYEEYEHLNMMRIKAEGAYDILQQIWEEEKASEEEKEKE
tara:strand:+ start:667 stop:855 length:189 start_codon:yes stop_codon:yes gene_type:complete